MSLEFIQIVKSANNDPKKSEAEDADASKRNKSEFDLQASIAATLHKMEKDKGDEPSKKIPEGFKEFVKSPHYKELLEAMLDYNRELFRLENKQQVLE